MTAHFSIEGHDWKETIFVARKCCDPAILGETALSQIESITIKYQGLSPPLVYARYANLPVEESSGQKYVYLESFSIVTL